MRTLGSGAGEDYRKPFEIIVARGRLCERLSFYLMSDAFMEARRLELSGWEVVVWPRLKTEAAA